MYFNLSLRVKGLKQLAILRSVQPIKWMTSRWLETALESKEGSSLEKTILSTSLGYVLCAPNHDDSEQPVLLSVQQFDWLREHDLEDARKPAVLPSYSECPLWKFEQFAPIFFERRFERATSHRHNLRQPRRSVGDASCHVHSPAVQASALLSGDDRPRSRFSCPASVRRISLSSGSSFEPGAVFTLQVICFHCVRIRLRLASDFSSDKPGPIRCSVLLSQVPTDCNDQASLCSACLHMDFFHALCSYVPQAWRTGECGHYYCRCYRPSSRNFCCLHQDLPPFASSADSTPSFRPSAATGGKHTEHGEVQDNGVRHDVDLRASPDLLPPLLVHSRLQSNWRTDGSYWVSLWIQYIACVPEFFPQPFRLLFPSAWCPHRSREAVAQDVLPIKPRSVNWTRMTIGSERV